ncbi:hypothetical protein DFH07DRAFT_787512 [Mycena maculata]|uniref:Uncharacterized protein n=1 Tax=Mycena maculata TaxID=230809 RepID=A0AAD7P2W9_9AGAR|nr:hypothetical protein DFH07DRAFT_787512 [Mycena maculata]
MSGRKMVESPPIYSPSTPSPIYSPTPQSTERILQHTPLPGHSRLTHSFIRKEHALTLVLEGQKENAGLPSFGRGAPLNGTLLLESPETVTSVRMEFRGILGSLNASHGYSCLRIIDQASSLYAKDPSQPRCPSAIAFSRRFPRTFKNNGTSYALPPSCDITLPDGSFFKCTYSLTVTVLASRHRSTSLFSKEKSLSVDLEYRERTRPSRPRISEPSLFSTVKICPEEWLQLPISLTARPDARAADIRCDLFVPSIGVFASPEIVPFHVQLFGAAHSLRELLLPRATNRTREHPESMRVYLLRQIAFGAVGSDAPATMNTILAEGALRPLPPAVLHGLSLPTNPHSRTATSDDALSWDGEIDLQGITTPSFDVGTFSVMYLITVELRPPEASSINRARYGYPIKITTDTWVGSAEQQEKFWIGNITVSFQPRYCPWGHSFK